MPRNEYEERAREFLTDSGTVLRLVEVCVVFGFPFDDPKQEKHPHVKYNVVLQRGKKTYDFPFYDSTYNYEHHKKPTAYDVLACLQSYPVEEDMWDFANEFGYEINSRSSYERVANIHRECVNQYNALLDLFGEEWLARLAELN